MKNLSEHVKNVLEDLTKLIGARENWWSGIIKSFTSDLEQKWCIIFFQLPH